jgi:hypothetical protein
MYEKHLHLDHVAEAEPETFEDCFDLVENANCPGPGVAIGLGGCSGRPPCLRQEELDR